MDSVNTIPPERIRCRSSQRVLLLLAFVAIFSGCGTTVRIQKLQSPLSPYRGPMSILVPGQAINGRALASIRVSGAFGAGFLDKLYSDLVSTARRLGANAVVIDQVKAVIASVEGVEEVPCNDFITEALLNAWDASRRDNPPVCHVSNGTYDAGYRVILRGRAMRLKESKR